MLIASRVLRTRDSIETRAFKTHFTWFASPLMWKIFATWRFQTPTHTVSLSLSSTLSQSLKHFQSSNTEITQTLAVKRSPSSACNEITLTVKRSPLSLDHISTIPSPIPWNHSNARRQTLTVLSVQWNYPHRQMLSPFLRPHSDDPRRATEVQILLFLKVRFS